MSGIQQFISILVMLSTICFIFLLHASNAEEIMHSSSGPIKGITTPSGDVQAFLGIPYAEPPIGDLRFRKPVPKKPWTQTLDANKFPPLCAQVSLHRQYYFLPNLTNMSEDCLYLNIWTPAPVANDTLKPVIIFIHHGGFIVGSGSMPGYDGTNFARRGDVVFVTINFRLGSFGFLYLGTEVDGNMAMYDQITAIRWVKDNAKVFGGDPDNIILFGVSAGAVAVGMHLVSPISQNLVNKAIIHSGGITMPYFYGNARLLKISEVLTKSVGCRNKTNNPETGPMFDVVDCLKRQSVDSIVKAQRVLLNSNPLLFFPRINDEFLPTSTIELIRGSKFKKDIPVLTGINNDEGPLFITTGTPEYFGFYGQNSSQQIRKNVAIAIARGLLSVANESNPSEVLDFYVSNVKTQSYLGYTKMIADMIGDYSVACSTVFQADFISLKGNPVFFYKFKFRSPSTPLAEWMGVTHLDELQYIFGNPSHENFTEEELDLSHRLIDRWSAFARTGNPNIPGDIPWPRYDYHNQFYLSIEQEEESNRMKPLERCKIWRKRFRSEIDSDLVRFMRNTGLDITAKTTS